MKKSRFLVLLVTSLCFVNCSKDASSDTVTETIQVNKWANLKATGDSANDILSNDNYDKLLIEIGYVTGFKPTTTAMSDLVEYLKERSFKQNIEIQYLALDSPEKETLSLKEIASLETKNRTAYTNGSTIAIYIYFSDAPSEEDDPENDLVTLGAVYRNTSMVIYESTIRDLSSKSVLISAGTVETATLNHEFGHLFGLVNIGSAMVHPHEGTTTDKDGNSIPSQHCDQDGCLMRAELEFSRAMGKMLTEKNGQVPDLDTECLLDLKANGGR